jgi:hypothetical protein
MIKIIYSYIRPQSMLTYHTHIKIKLHSNKHPWMSSTIIMINIEHLYNQPQLVIHSSCAYTIQLAFQYTSMDEFHVYVPVFKYTICVLVGFKLTCGHYQDNWIGHKIIRTSGR